MVTGGSPFITHRGCVHSVWADGELIELLETDSEDLVVEVDRVSQNPSFIDGRLPGEVHGENAAASRKVETEVLYCVQKICRENRDMKYSKLSSHCNL